MIPGDSLAARVRYHIDLSRWVYESPLRSRGPLFSRLCHFLGLKGPSPASF
jgi:hypothetical protein